MWIKEELVVIFCVVTWGFALLTKLSSG